MRPDAEPDLKISGLSVWVTGREFPGNLDQFDGNWLNVEARVAANRTKVECAGSILMASDFRRFRDELTAIDTTLAGEATLAGYEPNLKVTLTMRSLGHLECSVEITPDHLSEFHRFSFELDQSYLPGVISSCEGILARYPVI